MSLLSLNTTKINKLSLRDVTLPAPKVRELDITVDPVVNTAILKPVLLYKVKDVVEVKIETTELLKQPISNWDKLDKSSRTFWTKGARGGEIGFNKYDNR
jgi:hypothetical protein